MNEILLYKNISLILYSKRGPLFIVSLRDRWRDIYSERGLLIVPYLLLGARGCQCLHPLANRIVRDDLILCLAECSSLDSWFSVLCLNLTACLSRGLLLVTHLLYLTALMQCHCPVYSSQHDSLSKHTGSLGMNWKSMSYLI